MRIGEFALAHAETGEIEAQHADPGHRQPFGNALRCEVILAAGKAMRECAKATGLPSGRSIKAASFSSLALVNSVLSVRTICPFSETASLRQEPAQAAED